MCGDMHFSEIPEMSSHARSIKKHVWMRGAGQEGAEGSDSAGAIQLPALKKFLRTTENRWESHAQTLTEQ